LFVLDLLRAEVVLEFSSSPLPLGYSGSVGFTANGMSHALLTGGNLRDKSVYHFASDGSNFSKSTIEINSPRERISFSFSRQDGTGIFFHHQLGVSSKEGVGELITPFSSIVIPPVGTEKVRTDAAIATGDSTILVAGGSGEKYPYSHIYSWNTNEVQDSSWTLLKEQLSIPRSQLCGIYVRGYFLFVGGFDSKSPSNAVDVIQEQTLTRLPPPLTSYLITPRKDISVAEAGTVAFFVGGHDSHNYMDSIEFFSPSDYSFNASLRLSHPTSLPTLLSHTFSS
jgi:hypothetical protein